MFVQGVAVWRARARASRVPPTRQLNSGERLLSARACCTSDFVESTTRRQHFACARAMRTLHLAVSTTTTTTTFNEPSAAARSCPASLLAALKLLTNVRARPIGRLVTGDACPTERRAAARCRDAIFASSSESCCAARALWSQFWLRTCSSCYCVRVSRSATVILCVSDASVAMARGVRCASQSIDRLLLLVGHLQCRLRARASCVFKFNGYESNGVECATQTQAQTRNAFSPRDDRSAQNINDLSRMSLPPSND